MNKVNYVKQHFKQYTQHLCINFYLILKLLTQLFFIKLINWHQYVEKNSKTNFNNFIKKLNFYEFKNFFIKSSNKLRSAGNNIWEVACLRALAQPAAPAGFDTPTEGKPLPPETLLREDDKAGGRLRLAEEHPRRHDGDEPGRGSCDVTLLCVLWRNKGRCFLLF